MQKPETSDQPKINLLSLGERNFNLEFSGDWLLKNKLPDVHKILPNIAKTSQVTSLELIVDKQIKWDTGFVLFVKDIFDFCESHDVSLKDHRLPNGVKKLLELSKAVPPPLKASIPTKVPGLTEQIGKDTLELYKSSGEILGFLGEICLSFVRCLRGNKGFRQSDLWLTMQECGANSLPIVGLVSFLIGLILAYIGGQQLERFGAAIFIADLVGLAMVMQIGALITAIVLAGRTGASFAAQIGTMQVNEEIDALKTLGVNPIDFLILPRMIALILMTPLLAMYANLIGIFGGAFVGTLSEDISLVQYLLQTQGSIQLSHIVQGFVNATIYGAIVAISGCLRGIQCGRSASAVGIATTSAVVTSIVFIVMAASLLTILYSVMGL